MSELWLPVVQNEKYIVSDLGRVARLLRGAPQSKGYLKVSLYSEPGTPPAQPLVHQLVLGAFVGPCPPGKNVDHFDFDRTNNALANLRYLPKHVNDFRWNLHEQDVDPAEVARIDALYEQWERDNGVAGVAS